MKSAGVSRRSSQLVLILDEWGAHTIASYQEPVYGFDGAPNCRGIGQLLVLPHGNELGDINELLGQ